MSDGQDPSHPISVPDKPALEGLEAKWTAALGGGGRLPLRSHAAARRGVLRSTRRRRRSAARCTSATSSPTPTPTSIARFQRMRGKAVFYPMGWDDNGLPTERRVQNYYGVRCDPSLPYDPAFAPPDKPGKQPIPVSRPNFIELCTRLTAEDEKVFEHLWRSSRPVGRLVDDLRDDRPPGAAGVAAGVPAAAAARRWRISSRRRRCGTSTSGPPSRRPSSRIASSRAPITGSASRGPTAAASSRSKPPAPS